MFFLRKLAFSFALVASAMGAKADTLVYIVNGSQQFGTLDLNTGAFQQIGPMQPELGSFGLATAPNGSLVTFAYSGNLYSIDSSAGTPALIGPTGLDDCATVSSPCGPTSASTLGNYGGKIYATDFANNLYTINPVTGGSSLIGATGIAPIPFVPGSTNPDGTFNFYDQALFEEGGKLYETFDAFVFNFDTFSVVDVVINPALYQLDPFTGTATMVGPTDLSIGAVTVVGGAPYAFNVNEAEIERLNLTDGSTSFVSNFDPAVGVIQGAVPVLTPEPSSISLLGIGLFGLGACARNKLLRTRISARSPAQFSLDSRSLADLKS